MFDAAWADAFHRVYTAQIMKFLLQGLKNTMYIASVTIVLSLILGTLLGLLRAGKLKVARRLRLHRGACADGHENRRPDVAAPGL